MSTLPQAIVAPPLPPAPAASPAAKRVSIADRVARSFPPLACVRGFRYFARKKIDLVSVTETAIDADVKGKRTQRVRLRAVDGRLASSCSCAARMLGPAACRHVWATLLEIDRSGALEGLRTTQRSLALGVIGDDPPKPAEATAGTTKRRRARGGS